MTTSTPKNPGSLCLTGALEIQTAESVRSVLLDALTGALELRLDLGEIGACDAAGAQILWSARRTAAQAGKVILFEHATPAILECWSALGLPPDFFTPASPDTPSLDTRSPDTRSLDTRPL